MVGSPLKDLVDGEDLTLGSFSLELPTQVIPELGLCDDFVSGKQSDGIDFGVGVLIGGKFASEYKILPNLSVLDRSTFICSDGSLGS